MHLSDYDEVGEYEISEEEMSFNAEMESEESWYDKAEENTEQLQATQEASNELAMYQQKRYAGGMLSKDDLLSHTTNRISHSYDTVITQAYVNVKGNMWNDDGYFEVRNGNLYGTDGQLYIKALSQSDDLKALNESAKDKNSKVYADEDIDESQIKSLGSYEIKDAFYIFLSSLDAWDFADGRFDEEMKRLLME